MPASLPLTKYHQIYLVLREQLQEGRFVHGLPGELELTRQFGVGRVTVRRALEQLVEEGLIVREAGRGTRPTTRAEQGIKPTASADAAHTTTRLSGLLENIVSVSRSTSVKVLDWRLIHASAEIAAALQIPEGAPLRKAVRRRSASAGPVSHITTYVPEALVQGFGRRELAHKPILQLLEESGIELGRARQTVSARQADAQVAAELQVAVGTALLSVRRLVYDSHDRPVQLLHGLYRPDRYEYQMELSQVGAIDARIVAKEILP
ncbi:GntR family transcriptional regulator [Hydrogenophaga sp. OTU3427]|uniref:GntR family transcriptional regulator n=1 Tax=Hydrogenophaga sp. OTU3427 TaxID=3043856 RepID=UPI00313C3064